MRFVKVILLILSSVLLAACGLTKPVNLPPVSTYTISSLDYASGAHARTQLTLLVTMPVANPGYRTTAMVYIQVPYKLRAFANNRWVAAPANMLLPLFANAIRKQNYFKAVLTPPFSGVTNYRLDTKILVLQQEFLQPTSEVRLVVQASLISNRTSRVISSRRFQSVIKAPDNDPYSGVLAANKAATIVSNQIAKFVLNAIR